MLPPAEAGWAHAMISEDPTRHFAAVEDDSSLATNTEVG